MSIDIIGFPDPNNGTSDTTDESTPLLERELPHETFQQIMAQVNARVGETDPFVRKLKGDFIRDEAAAARASDKVERGIVVKVGRVGMGRAGWIRNRNGRRY